MATDTVLEIRFSDDVVLFRGYIRSDTHPESFIPEVYSMIKSLDFDYRVNKTNWCYLATSFIGKVICSGRMVKVLEQSQTDDSGVCYKTIIKADHVRFGSSKNIVDAVSIKTTGSSGDVVCDGVLSDVVDDNSNEISLSQIIGVPTPREWD